MQPKPKIHPAVAALIVIVLIGIVTSLVITVNNSKSAKNETSSTINPLATQSAPSTPSTSTESPAVTSTDTSKYKDGTYMAKAQYVTPGGIESIGLTVTITGGVITDSQITASGNTDHAEEHQQAFAGGYKTLVVGKDIDTLELSRVSGASLTSRAFNDALDQIKQDAEA